MVFILMIIYTNFLIASVSDTYEKVTDVQEATFTKTQLEYLTMMMEINEGEENMRDNMIVKLPFGSDGQEKKWLGFVGEVKKVIKEQASFIKKNQKLQRKQAIENNKRVWNTFSTIFDSCYDNLNKQTDNITQVNLLVDKQR